MTARELIKILLELPLEEKIEFYLMGRYKGKKYKNQDPETCYLTIKDKDDIDLNSRSIVIYLNLDESYDYDYTDYPNKKKKFNNNLNLIEEKRI
jgi:hypothetical protein